MTAWLSALLAGGTQHLTILRASMACYGDNFTFCFTYRFKKIKKNLTNHDVKQFLYPRVSVC
jgi:hypothetical protein